MNQIKQTRGKLLLIVFCIVLISKINAQNTQHEDLNEGHKTEKDPGLELVFSGLVVYAPEEELYEPAIEIHLTYWVSHVWAYGIGYTQLYEKEGKLGHEIAGLASYKPWHFLTANFGPSFSLPDSNKDLEVSAYVECEFNFEIGGFHTGPLFGTLIGKEVKFFSGIHLGYDF